MGFVVVLVCLFDGWKRSSAQLCVFSVWIFFWVLFVWLENWDGKESFDELCILFCVVSDGWQAQDNFLKNKNKNLSKFSLWTVWFPRKLRKNREKMKLMNLDFNLFCRGFPGMKKFVSKEWLSMFLCVCVCGSVCVVMGLDWWISVSWVSLCVWFCVLKPVLEVEGEREENE